MKKRLFMNKEISDRRVGPKSLSTLLIIALTVSLLSFSIAADENTWKLGTKVKTGKDNGYSGQEEIDKDDPHYGWDLGQFYVSGFTQHTTDSEENAVFLKNVGDKVQLNFQLLQNIDSLNNDSNLTIYADTNGYDKYFSTQQYNECRGLLIIRKTDYQNTKAEPVVYNNYLVGFDKGANKVVELCEEGDYEVALDYEIREEHYGVDWNTYVSIPTYTNYRIYFKFKVRNGNCMVFPFDTTTGSELSNEAFTENGFYLDLANSRYLDINVKRYVYVEGTNGYTKDLRYNHPASDGEKYTDEGVYEITVINRFTDQETLKTIYVGTDPMMKAYVVSGYSLEDLQDLLGQGYQIAEDGSLIAPATSDNNVVEEEIDVDEDEDIEEFDDEEETEDNTSKKKRNKTSSKSDSGSAIPVIVVLLVLIGGGAFIFIKKKGLLGSHKNPVEKKEVPNDSSIAPLDVSDSKEDNMSKDESSNTNDNEDSAVEDNSDVEEISDDTENKTESDESEGE